MIKLRPFFVPESVIRPRTSDRHAADTLAAAIRKPRDTLDLAAEEAANGMLGRAKLGLLVAANDLRSALEAVDAEFKRQNAACSAVRRQRQVDRSAPDRKSF